MATKAGNTVETGHSITERRNDGKNKETGELMVSSKGKVPSPSVSSLVAGNTEETGKMIVSSKGKVSSPFVSSFVAGKTEETGKVIVCSNIEQWNECTKKEKVLAFFGVPSDGRVVQIYPTIKDLAARYPKVCVVQVDINKLKSAADEMGVESTPALVFKEEGKAKVDILHDFTKKNLEDMENKF